MTEFTVQGVPASQIAAEFGTPYYVYDSEVIRQGYHRLRDQLHPRVDILFSLKANPNVSVCAYLRSLGAGAEVSSRAELMTALRAGVDPRDVIFLGPGKTVEDLTACLQAGIYAVVCESLAELELLDELAAERGESQVGALIRVNPDFHTKGSGLAMGGKPRQFGIDADAVRAAAPVVQALRAVRVLGFQAYMGTRFLNHSDVAHNTAQILAMTEDLAERLDIELHAVDFGGGLGVAYFDNEKELDVEALATALAEVLEPFAARHPRTRLIMELGRYLTAMCGTYVARALYVKDSLEERFVVTDGGTNHHMAAVGIGSFVKRNFPIRLLSRYDEEPVGSYTITGPLCTPNDVIGKKVALPDVEAGDLIGVERSGAYGPTASPVLFLSHGYPAEVFVRDGVAHLVAERDTPEDLLRRQRLVVD